MLAEQHTQGLLRLGHPMLGADIELVQDRRHQLGIVGRVDGQRIACLIDDPGTREVELVVADLLVGSGCGEQPIHGQGSSVVRVAFLHVNRRLDRRGLGDGAGGGGTGVGGDELFDEVGGPRRRGFLVVTIDIHPVGEPGGTELFQPRIEEFARVAEQFVGGVAEGQDREAHVLQSIGRAADRLPEQGGGVRELTVAEGRGDHDEMRCPAELVEFHLIEFHGLGRNSGGGGGFGERHRSVFRVAHIGAIGDHQRELTLGHIGSPHRARDTPREFRVTLVWRESRWGPTCYLPRAGQCEKP